MEKKRLVTVEVVYALPEQQWLLTVGIEHGATLADAIEKSNIVEKTGIDLDQHTVGIFGQIKSLDEQIKEGDRIEIYRALPNDPKELRRKKAELNPLKLTKRQQNLRNKK